MKKIIIGLIILIPLLLANLFVLASSDNRQGPSDRQGPPPEALTACEGKSAGDSAEFTGQNGESITGTCEEMNGSLILRPDNPPPQREGQTDQQSNSGSQGNQSNGQRQGPPPEAYTACEGKSAGDTAELEGRDGGSISGSCTEINGKLVLVPDNMQR